MIKIMKWSGTTSFSGLSPRSQSIRETYENLRETKIFKSKILGESKEKAAGNYGVLWEKSTGRARKRWGERTGEERTAENRVRETTREGVGKGRGGRRWTRIRPLRDRQQAPAGGNGVKCSGNNEVFRCPFPVLRSRPSVILPRFRR